MKSLDRIAQRQNPLTVVDYLDSLIETEKIECKQGWQERVKYLQEARRDAKVIKEIGEGKMPPNDHYSKEWFKQFAQRLSEVDKVDDDIKGKSDDQNETKPQKSGIKLVKMLKFWE